MYRFDCNKKRNPFLLNLSLITAPSLPLHRSQNNNLQASYKSQLEKRVTIFLGFKLGYTMEPEIHEFKLMLFVKSLYCTQHESQILMQLPGD